MPCLIHFEYNIRCIIWSTQDFHLSHCISASSALCSFELWGYWPAPVPWNSSRGGELWEQQNVTTICQNYSCFFSCKALAQACEWFSRARQHNVWPGLQMVHLEIFRSPWPVLQWNKRSAQIASMEVESLLNWIPGTRSDKKPKQLCHYVHFCWYIANMLRWHLEMSGRSRSYEHWRPPRLQSDGPDLNHPKCQPFTHRHSAGTGGERRMTLRPLAVALMLCCSNPEAWAAWASGGGR